MSQGRKCYVPRRLSLFSLYGAMLATEKIRGGRIGRPYLGCTAATEPQDNRTAAHVQAYCSAGQCASILPQPNDHRLHQWAHSPTCCSSAGAWLGGPPRPPPPLPLQPVCLPATSSSCSQQHPSQPQCRRANPRLALSAAAAAAAIYPTPSQQPAAAAVPAIRAKRLTLVGGCMHAWIDGWG